MVKRFQPNITSKAIAELQVALDMQDAAEKLVATRLARLATLLSATDSRRADARRAHQPGPVLVVDNPPVHGGPMSDEAA
jgi:hypothetical protein